MFVLYIINNNALLSLYVRCEWIYLLSHALILQQQKSSPEAIKNFAFISHISALR